MYPISVPHLQQIANPFDSVVWHLDIDSPITRQEIQTAIAQGRTVSQPCNMLPALDWVDASARRRRHVERVAFLVMYGWFDPIMIDVGLPDYFFGARPPFWPITDGNHRVAAAIFRKDPFIPGNVVGSIEEACRLGLGPPSHGLPPLPLVVNG